MGPVAYFGLSLLGCLIFNPSLEGIGATSCRSGWMHYQQHCYGLFPEKVSWTDAEMECQHHRKGAHLATILTPAEGNMVARYISKSGFTDDVWIGLHDPNLNGHWMWTEGSRYRYKAWNAEEPNNTYEEYCVELVNHSDFKKWNDRKCEKENAYLCKYELERRK
ncbi:regenerating islet-derived protein 4-like [Emys orbicularis]|uniref:regenerating islet-derived protein 4-like n=1 Tax=Emys orbicularis TaxID=82168 RepID=UPI0031FE416E